MTRTRDPIITKRLTDLRFLLLDHIRKKDLLATFWINPRYTQLRLTSGLGNLLLKVLW